MYEEKLHPNNTRTRSHRASQARAEVAEDRRLMRLEVHPLRTTARAPLGLAGIGADRLTANASKPTDAARTSRAAWPESASQARLVGAARGACCLVGGTLSCRIMTCYGADGTINSRRRLSSGAATPSA